MSNDDQAKPDKLHYNDNITAPHDLGLHDLGVKRQRATIYGETVQKTEDLYDMKFQNQFFVVMVEGVAVTKPLDTATRAQMQINQLPAHQQALAEIVITDNEGRRLLLG